MIAVTHRIEAIMQADLLIHNIGQLVTLSGRGTCRPVPGAATALRELGLINGAAVAICGWSYPGSGAGTGPEGALCRR